MQKSADVAVLGAGVAGCATAYYLAREGVDVVVVERGAIGSGASGFALGLLNPLSGTGMPGPMQHFAEAAFRMHLDTWPLLREESTVDFKARLVPHLELFFSEDELRRGRDEIERWSRTDGFSVRWLDRGDARGLEPRLSDDVEAVALVESLCLLDSYRYTLALARAAEWRGTTFAYGEVTGVKADGTRITGVELDEGEIACGAVVVALGPWSGLASEWLGMDLPVEPVKGQIIHLEGPEQPLEQHINGPCAVVQKADGLVWVGSTIENDGFDTTTTAEGRDLLIEQAVSMLPSLAEAGIVSQTACLRPVAPDSLPLVGQAPGWEGAYIATGAERKGMLLGPAIGRAVADLILRSETPLPIAPFSPGRFAR